MEEERGIRYAGILSKLIRMETVSETGVPNEEKFFRFHRLLEETFPHLFHVTETEKFGGSLLMRWPGRKAQDPILLMSHHDVVEAAGPWSHGPFSGDIAGGKVWGRGTLDTKGSLWAMLQAAEELAAQGYTPERDVWFASSCTEETDGSGADQITRTLQERKIRFSLVLDEGGMMLPEPIAGADGTFAMIGVGEKGCADLKFIARSSGGHASTPGRDTPLVRLGKFMAEADRAACFRPQLSPVTEEMFRRLAPSMKGGMRFLLAHAGQLKGLLCRVMPGVSDTAAVMLRTTLAFTMSHGSEGRNVLPQEAWIIGNMRYSHHQGGPDSIAAVTALAEKYGVETEVLDAGFPSHVTDFRSPGFRQVEKAVSAVFPGVHCVPYIMTGASDSRFFSRVSDCCLRFAPFLISQEQLGSIHGVDENVDISALAGAVDFYQIIIRGETV